MVYYKITIQNKLGERRTFEAKSINFHSNGAIDIHQFDDLGPFFPGKEEDTDKIEIEYIQIENNKE